MSTSAGGAAAREENPPVVETVSEGEAAAADDSIKKTESTSKPINSDDESPTQHGSNSSSTDEDPPLFQFLTGMKEDLAARLPIYKDDWSRPKSIFTVVNATVFAFVIQLIPALIFAELMDRETEGNLATAEV